MGGIAVEWQASTRTGRLVSRSTRRSLAAEVERLAYVPVMEATRRVRSALWLVAGVAVVGAFGCGSGTEATPTHEYAGLLPFDTAQVRLVSSGDTSTVTVELAETPDQHAMGLMERQVLPADAGMLFLYSAVQPESSGFWMFRTRFPLDIAFIDSLGVIRSIQTMTPCASSLAQGCPSYPAGAAYIAALEVNAGYFAGRQLRVGDRVLLQDTASRRPASRPSS